jgi:hypothetical protein
MFARIPALADYTYWGSKKKIEYGERINEKV